MKGILFKPEMIKAIDECRKTATRRLSGLKEINEDPDNWRTTGIYDNIFCFKKITPDEWILPIRPHYQIGEVVYIKEEWAAGKRLDYMTPSEIGKAAIVSLWYKFNDKPTELGEPERGKWRSPMFMPAWAARYHIKILSVRIERLQEITMDDCKLEGIHGYTFAKGVLSNNPPDARWAFIELWDSINPKYSWSSNPWCFVYTFQKQ